MITIIIIHLIIIIIIRDAHFIQRMTGSKGNRPFREKEYYRFCVRIHYY